MNSMLSLIPRPSPSRLLSWSPAQKQFLYFTLSVIARLQKRSQRSSHLTAWRGGHFAAECLQLWWFLKLSQEINGEVLSVCVFDPFQTLAWPRWIVPVSQKISTHNFWHPCSNNHRHPHFNFLSLRIMWLHLWPPPCNLASSSVIAWMQTVTAIEAFSYLDFSSLG